MYACCLYVNHLYICKRVVCMSVICICVCIIIIIIIIIIISTAPILKKLLALYKIRDGRWGTGLAYIQQWSIPNYAEILTHKSNTHTHTHTHTRARARTHTHTRTHARARAHKHTHTHTYTRTHTHTQTEQDWANQILEGWRGGCTLLHAGVYMLFLCQSSVSMYVCVLFVSCLCMYVCVCT